MSNVTKRLGWLLALSLGLNVFLLGYESARWLQRRATPTAERFGPKGPPRHLLGPPSPEFKAQRAELGAARSNVAAALQREPFDRQALAGALEKLREVTSRGQELLHRRMMERAAELPLEQRKSLANTRLLRGREPR